MRCVAFTDTLIARLVEAREGAAAWGYRPHSDGWAEPTALAAMALSAHVQAAELVAGGLEWLVGIQQADGAVPVATKMDGPHWTTALALLAWCHTDPVHRERFHSQTERAAAWLIEAKGIPLPRNERLQDHDTTLVGWSWVAQTHSWIEPTSYAVLALRAAGQADHARAREGVRLILDRALPDGGWNYGNRRVLTHVLRPFPATTGASLTALAGEPRTPEIDRSIEYLSHELQRVRTPLSLSWGVIGLRAWGALPTDAENWLEETAERVLAQPANPLYDALLLLAAAQRCPLLTGTEDVDHG